MKKKNVSEKKEQFNDIDNFINQLAQNDYQPVPEKIHKVVTNTITNIDYKAASPKNKKSKTFLKDKKLCTFVITQKTFLIICLLIILFSTSIVGARQISEKIFNKDHIRLDEIGISNEFIFNDTLEKNLKQNVPLNLIELDNNYSIDIHSVLVDEINMFITFELHSKNKFDNNLEFNIDDLKISDENNNLLYNFSEIESKNNIASQKNIYSLDNTIKELFFIFGNNNSNLKTLNFSFSKITLSNNNQKIDIHNINHLEFENKELSINLTKNNYNTKNEFILEHSSENADDTINNAIFTNTGFYLLIESPRYNESPIIKSNDKIYQPIYSIPLKRYTIDSTSLLLIAYNIEEISDNITLNIKENNSTYTLKKLN